MRTNYLVDGFKIGEDIFPIPYNLENKEIEEQDILDVLNKYCYLDNFLDFGNKEDSKDYNDIVNVIQNTMVYSRKFFVSVY